VADEVQDLNDAKRGTTSNGVPFVALQPGGAREARALVILWHGADPPRTEEALAAAVPLFGLPAWRVYLGLPGYGARMPEGGLDEVMRRGTEDAVSLLFAPTMTGALAELSDAVADLRKQFRIDASLPLGIFGFSVGGATALLAISRRVLPFRAAVTFGAVPDLPALVDVSASFFGVRYEWTQARKSLAEELSPNFDARALAESGVPVLLAVGADDPYPIRGPTEKLVADVKAAGGSPELRIVPGVPHAFVAEPGIEAAPQSDAARAIDALAGEWFARYLTDS
jgi:dienelactone hydrolase